jgi:hypothetical protein
MNQLCKHACFQSLADVSRSALWHVFMQHGVKRRDTCRDALEKSWKSGENADASLLPLQDREEPAFVPTLCAAAKALRVVVQPVYV